MKSKKVFKQPQTKKADTVLIVEEQAELMKFLIEKLPTKSRFNIKTLLKERQIWVRGRAISQFNHELKVGDEITVKWVKTFETKQFRGMRIIFEDDYLL